MWQFPPFTQRLWIFPSDPGYEIVLFPHFFHYVYPDCFVGLYTGIIGENLAFPRVNTVDINPLLA